VELDLYRAGKSRCVRSDLS